MRVARTMSYGGADDIIDSIGLQPEILGLVSAPHFRVGRGLTGALKRHLNQELAKLGWATRPRLNPSLGLNVNGIKSQVALTIQTGNIARAYYDLLKFEFLFVSGRIRAAALLIP